MQVYYVNGELQTSECFDGNIQMELKCTRSDILCEDNR